MGMGFGFGGIGMIIFWIIILAALVYFIRYLVPRDRRQTGDTGAMEILKKRYASGEISKDEFDQLRHELKRT